MKNIFFTAAEYLGGKLRAGNFAVHTSVKQIYFGITDKTTVELLHSGKDSGWVAANLTNGWVVYDEIVAYRLDATGQLHFKGTARYGALNYPIFQLPTEFRPTRNISKVILMLDGFGRLDINIDGYVIPSKNIDPLEEIIEVDYMSMECGVML